MEGEEKMGAVLALQSMHWRLTRRCLRDEGPQRFRLDGTRLLRDSSQKRSLGALARLDKMGGRQTSLHCQLVPFLLFRLQFIINLRSGR